MGGLGAKEADDAEHPADDHQHTEEDEDFHRYRRQQVGERVKEIVWGLAWLGTAI
jgi:hypothetical protein